MSQPDDGINAREVARIVGLRHPQRVYEIRYFRERAFRPQGARGWRWVREDALMYRELTRVSPDARLTREVA